MIPLLGVPVLNREDLAARMVESVDHPVEELLVVVNAQNKMPALERIGDAADANPNIRKATFSLPSFNLGCGGSWNHIMRHRPVGPWWLIVNADIQFAPGDLARLDEHMWAADGPTLGSLFQFGAFAPNTACVDAVGWFDENFHPMYYEDRDYEYRMKLAGVPYVQLPSETTHATSSTIHSDQRLFDRNRETFAANGAYYAEKWGASPYQERYRVPFDGRHPVDLQRGRLVRQSW